MRADLDQPANTKIMDTIRLYNSYLNSTGVVTDSRSVKKGSIFFALKGDNFDGNDFVDDAIAAGALCAVTDKKGAPHDNHHFIVEDTLEALQELACYHRKQLKIPVIGLTGTNGKTTTKELITRVMSVKFKTGSTSGNFNNHIGVPLTILSFDKNIEAAVIEMGASSKGEIDLLTKIACPDLGLITNVGKAHLLGFGSFEGVKAAKGELYDYLLETNGTAFINRDNRDLVEMAALRNGLKTIPYGLDFQGFQIKPATAKSPFLTLLTPGGGSIKTNLIGTYNADNILAALAIAQHFDIDPAAAVAAIELYVPSNNRSQLMNSEKNTLIVDAYNANPTSMKISLENFRALKATKKVLIIGDMLELGHDSQKEHEAILSIIAQLNAKRTFFVGKEFEKAAKGIEYFDKNSQFFPDSLALQEHLRREDLKGYTIFIKGSRGTKLERCIEAL